MDEREGNREGNYKQKSAMELVLLVFFLRFRCLQLHVGPIEGGLQSFQLCARVRVVLVQPVERV